MGVYILHISSKASAYLFLFRAWLFHILHMLYNAHESIQRLHISFIDYIWKRPNVQEK